MLIGFFNGKPAKSEENPRIFAAFAAYDLWAAFGSFRSRQVDLKAYALAQRARLTDWFHAPTVQTIDALGVGRSIKKLIK